EEFASKPENFAIYKMYTTHQAAHLEFGSFLFDFGREGNCFESRRQAFEDEQRTSGRLTKTEWLTDMERFFDLFSQRQLAADLFTLTEEARFDSYVGREYSGIRRAMQNMDWEQVTQEDLEKMIEEMGEGAGEVLDELPEGEEEEYHGADQVDFRGDFKPEMVQLLMKLRLEQGQDESAAPLTAEQLK